MDTACINVQELIKREVVLVLPNNFLSALSSFHGVGIPPVGATANILIASPTTQALMLRLTLDVHHPGQKDFNSPERNTSGGKRLPSLFKLLTVVKDYSMGNAGVIKRRDLGNIPDSLIFAKIAVDKPMWVASVHDVKRSQTAGYFFELALKFSLTGE